MRNGGADFGHCLDSILRSTFRDWELIVVDDGSEDSSALAATEAGAKVLQSAGRGPAAARNLGAREASGEFLFFLDADCSLAPRSLERAAATLAADSGLDALFGSYDDSPSAPGLAAQYKNLQHHFVHQRGKVEAETFWAGCGVVRRATFLQLGGFDEQRFRRPAVEDVELGSRLRAAGHRIRLAKDVQVTHHKAWTLAGIVKSDLLDRGIPWTELLIEGRAAQSELNLGVSGRVSAAGMVLLVAAVLAAPFQPGALTVAGLAAFVLLTVNLSFYRFLRQRRGVAFAAAAVPLHWLYHLNCAVAFAVGSLRSGVRFLQGKRAIHR